MGLFDLSDFGVLRFEDCRSTQPGKILGGHSGTKDIFVGRKFKVVDFPDTHGIEYFPESWIVNIQLPSHQMRHLAQKKGG